MKKTPRLIRKADNYRREDLGYTDERIVKCYKAFQQRAIYESKYKVVNLNEPAEQLKSVDEAIIEHWKEHGVEELIDEVRRAMRAAKHIDKNHPYDSREEKLRAFFDEFGGIGYFYMVFFAIYREGPLSDIHIHTKIAERKGASFEENDDDEIEIPDCPTIEAIDNKPVNRLVYPPGYQEISRFTPAPTKKVTDFTLKEKLDHFFNFIKQTVNSV